MWNCNSYIIAMCATISVIFYAIILHKNQWFYTAVSVNAKAPGIKTVTGDVSSAELKTTEKRK